MQGQGSGSIVNISSTYGHEGAAGASVYAGSKHAVEGITKSVALVFAKSGICRERRGPWSDGHRHVDPLYRGSRPVGRRGGGCAAAGAGGDPPILGNRRR